MTIIRRLIPATPMIAAGILAVSTVLVKAQEFQQVNLITDNQAANPATLEDPNLVNAWGVSFSGTSPVWVSDNGSGVSTVYRVNPVTDIPTKVNFASPSGGISVGNNPTGQANNPLASAGAFNGDVFLFVNEDGKISGWRNALGVTAETLAVADPGNVYKGTTFGSVGGHGYLYSANFRAGSIDVLKGDTGAPDLTGKFLDPNLPAGFAPFNIRNLGGKLFVTFAMQDGAKHDELAGVGQGFVDEFDLQGNLVERVGTRGSLNAPWGLEIAPASFGPLAGDLLVGNFGDGTIDAFKINGPGFDGQLQGAAGPLKIDGLWALTVGNDGGAGSSDKLYFSAGPNDEGHGLFGLVRTVPDGASTMSLLTIGVSALIFVSRKIRSRD